VVEPEDLSFRFLNKNTYMEIAAGLRQFLQDLRDWWQRLFGGGDRAAGQAGGETSGAAVPIPTFADFHDPFTHDGSSRYPMERLVSYTFQALMALASDRGYPRQKEQTPHEFAATIGQREPVLANEAMDLANLYGRLAYADGRVPGTALPRLRKIWRRVPRAGMRRAAVLPVLLVAAVLLAGCAETLAPQGFVESGSALSRPVPWQEGAEAPAVVEHEIVSVDTLPRGESDPIYRLGPGDRLAINVFGEPGMENLIVQVDGAGEIQVPMIEHVKASGLSLGELQNLLKEAYGKHFMQPWVVVQLQEPLSRPLYLLGEFNQPGIVHMSSDMNLIQALGAGRGLSDKAYTRGARLIRDDKIVAVDINALLNRGHMDQNVWLAPNDTIFVPGLDDLRVFVLGAVAAPGAQTVTNGPLTLADAIARSGGPRRGQAMLDQVRVIRSNSPVSGELFVVDFKRIVEGLAMDMPLEPGDIVYLPVNGMGGWNEVIEAISPTILMFSRALDPFVMAKALED